MKKALAFAIALCIGACSGPVTVNVQPCGEGGSGGTLDAGVEPSDDAATQIGDWICSDAQPREWFSDGIYSCSYCECETQKCFAAPFVSGETPLASGVCDSNLKCSESCEAHVFPNDWP